MENKKESVAIIGAGVAGIVTSILLQPHYDIILYEKSPEIGGHTNTFVIPNGEDAGTAVDTGFIVLNDKTYPNFQRFLAEMGVEVRFSDMSFGFECAKTGLQYSGRGLNGLFAQRRNVFKPSYLLFLKEIARFAKHAARDLENETIPDLTLTQYLSANKYSQDLIDNYIVPMGAAIWSAPVNDILNFPAATFLRFFYNHGLLALKDRPRWQTVVGGSHSYLKAFKKCFGGKIENNAKIQFIERIDGKVFLNFDNAERKQFDRVVIATHADQALRLLKDPSEEEKSLFGLWKYQKNHTVLHTDVSIMPSNRNAWASWNYYRGKIDKADAPLAVTYYMNLLQGLNSKNHYCVTLNSQRVIAEEKILLEIEYQHPIFSPAAVASQKVISKLNGQQNTWYCGSYLGYGFHEDAVKAAIAVSVSMGIKW